MANFYEYVFKGLLTEEALDKAGRKVNLNNDDEEISLLWERLGINQLDHANIERSRRMSIVFIAITAFENYVRDFISKKLLEEAGEEWWEKRVSEKVKDKASRKRNAENKQRYHTQRGDLSLEYTEFQDLISIIQKENNWPLFEPHLVSIEWTRNIFNELEKSRNVIMHSGYLENTDIERVGMNIRDWIKQVG